MNGNTTICNDPEDKYLPLLQEILAPIRRAGETPLQARIDGTGIIHAAISSYKTETPQKELQLIFDDLINKALSDVHTEINDIHTTENGQRTLGTWLEDLFTAMRSVDSQAVEIVARRIEGEEVREIAEKLDLGLRLVKRIVRDVKLNITKGMKP